MGNCFVTKLKESVNNNSLVKLNEVRFTTSAEAGQRIFGLIPNGTITATFSIPITVKDINAQETLATDVTSFTASYGFAVIIPANTVMTISIDDKKNIRFFSLDCRTNAEFKGLSALVNLTTFDMNQIKGINDFNIDAFRLSPNLENLYLEGYSSALNIDSLFDYYVSIGRTTALTVYIGPGISMTGRVSGQSRYSITFSGGTWSASPI